MLPFWIFLGLGAVFSVSSFFYLKKSEKKHPLPVSIVMFAVLLGYCVFCLSLDGVWWIKELEYILMISLCIPVAWVDICEKKIPNVLVLAGLIAQIITIVIMFFYDLDYALTYFKSAGIGFLFIAIFCAIGYLVIKNGIGMGDIKLLLVLSIMGGIDNILSILFFSMVVAFFMGLYELIIKKRGKKATIPFGPATLVGTIVTAILSILQ